MCCNCVRNSLSTPEKASATSVCEIKVAWVYIESRCFEAGGASSTTASTSKRNGDIRRHLLFSLSLCILLCECLRSACSRLEINNMKIRHLHLRREDLLRFLDLNEPCLKFLCDKLKGARLYTITSECDFTGPMPWSLSPPTSLNPPQHGSPPSLQWQGGFQCIGDARVLLAGDPGCLVGSIGQPRSPG